MKKRDTYWVILKTLLVTVMASLFVMPMVWMVLTSLKKNMDVFSVSWIPKVWEWRNYVYIWTNKSLPLPQVYLNNLKVVILGTIGFIIVSSLAAYAFAKIRFKGRGFVFTLFLASIMIPGQLTVIPQFMMFRTMGLYNSHWAIILPDWFGVSAIFLLRQFYLGLPDELMEAAKVDGAKHLRIFGQIMMPLTKPAILSLVLLHIIACWDNYLGPLIYLNKPNLFMISQSIRWYMLEDAQRYEYTMAMATCSILPIVVFFIACQKHFVEGIATAGLKV